MIEMRQSPAADPNERLQATPPDRSVLEPSRAAAARERAISNRQWLRETGVRDGVILLGGISVVDFRIRFAQSQLRSDLLPSFWSMAGLLQDGETFLSVPLDRIDDAAMVPSTNGVQTCRLQDYDDPERFPNIAVLRFTDDLGRVLRHVEQTRLRSVVDLPALVVTWLGYVWGVGQKGNPLLEGSGLPSAVFVETAHALAGIEVTPGLSAAASCPEAIWQAGKWWHDYYRSSIDVAEAPGAPVTVPEGYFAVRQPAAVAVGPNDRVVGTQVLPAGRAAAAPEARGRQRKKRKSR